MSQNLLELMMLTLSFLTIFARSSVEIDREHNYISVVVGMSHRLKWTSCQIHRDSMKNVRGLKLHREILAGDSRTWLLATLNINKIITSRDVRLLFWLVLFRFYESINWFMALFIFLVVIFLCLCYLMFCSLCEMIFNIF